MNFNEEEKVAIAWSLLALAEVDGSKTMEELRKITDITMSIGFDPSKGLALVNNLKNFEAYAVFRKCTLEKKAFIKKTLEELASADTEINHLEKEALSQIILFGEL